MKRTEDIQGEKFRGYALKANMWIVLLLSLIHICLALQRKLHAPVCQHFIGNAQKRQYPADSQIIHLSLIHI